ncbi:MAG: GIY-YIG nuclease family protein, partial [Campylobacterota bacterium]|nr:GIY-YIG nuclease family protein [Campylobacterota bacterium]
MNYKIKFSEIEYKVNNSSGVYEIFTNEDIPLKVGISNNLKRRLKQHRNSKQKYLKIKNQELPITLSNIESKQSILAKHLYFDNSLTVN